MVAASVSVQKAKDVIADVQNPMAQALTQAAAHLSSDDCSESQALAKAASMLIAELAKVISAAADSGRAADARTFEAMFDVNAASTHFQSAMEEGVRHAAQEIAKDGYEAPSATMLAVSRALDSVADLLR